MKISSINLQEALSGNPVESIVLHPRDRVLVQRKLAAVDPVSVYVKGEVAKPGRYPLTEGMRVADLIRVAGGLKNNAYPVDADLTRYLVKGSLKATGEHIELHLPHALAGNPDANSLLSTDTTTRISHLTGFYK